MMQKVICKKCGSKGFIGGKIGTMTKGDVKILRVISINLIKCKKCSIVDVMPMLGESTISIEKK